MNLSYLVNTTMTGIFTSKKFTKMWKNRNTLHSRSLANFNKSSPAVCSISYPYEVIQCKAYRRKKNSVMRFTCTCSRSIALPSARFRRNDSTIVDLSKTRFKAYTVVEDEAWILFRVVLLADVCFSNATMSDINGGLQTFQQWNKCF